MRKRAQRLVMAVAIGAMPFGTTVTCELPGRVVIVDEFYDDHDDHHHPGFFDGFVDFFDERHFYNDGFYIEGSMVIDEYY